MELAVFAIVFLGLMSVYGGLVTLEALHLERIVVLGCEYIL